MAISDSFFFQSRDTCPWPVSLSFLSDTMSINLSGTLTVQIIQGRRGPFKTTKLATYIGTFDVKIWF